MVMMNDKYSMIKNNINRYGFEFIIIGVFCLWMKIIVIVVKIIILM